MIISTLETESGEVQPGYCSPLQPCLEASMNSGK